MPLHCGQGLAWPLSEPLTLHWLDSVGAADANRDHNCQEVELGDLVPSSGYHDLSICPRIRTVQKHRAGGLDSRCEVDGRLYPDRLFADLNWLNIFGTNWLVHNFPYLPRCKYHHRAEVLWQHRRQYELLQESAPIPLEANCGVDLPYAHCAVCLVLWQAQVTWVLLAAELVDAAVRVFIKDFWPVERRSDYTLARSRARNS